MSNRPWQPRQAAGSATTSLSKVRKLLGRLFPPTTNLAPAMRRSGAFRFWWLRQLIKKFVGIRLGAIPQYPPRPLGLPKFNLLKQDPQQFSWQEGEAPVLAIVTPSFNQGHFLERTMQSVLGQDYVPLEYVVQDGGSSDESVAILDRYRPFLRHGESTRDRGQADAINRGFRHTTGDIMAYLNSDDLLLPGTLEYVARFFTLHPEVDVVYGHRVLVDENDADIGRWVLPPHDDKVLPWADYVPQETLFWRRRIWDKVGGAMDESFQFALDWDLLLRFHYAGARFVRLPRFLAAFRLHRQQKTSAQVDLGAVEMDRLRQRCHGRSVTYAEIGWYLTGFLWRHVLCDRLYRLGLWRY